MQPIIDMKNIHVLYGSTCAIDIEHLTIAAGERVFVLGRSGSGKTTLSRLIKGRQRPATGEVRVLGQDPTSTQSDQGRAVQRRIAMIDQEFYLIPRHTVISNILSGALGRVSTLRTLIGWYPSGEWQVAEEILSEVELEGFGARRIETLSGGQRQRTAIARALMQDAEIIIADEPISNLDPELAEDALGLLINCAKRRGVTLVVNLHQPSLARQFATRLIGLSEGKMIYDGPPEGFTASMAEIVYRGGYEKNGKANRSKGDNKSRKTVEDKATVTNLRLLND